MAEPVYVIEGFHRWMRKQVLRDLDLCRAVAEMTRGLIDADLGSGLLKKRIARSGAGKSRGYRAVVANRRDRPWFFVQGYAKSERDSVDGMALALCRVHAASLLSMSATDISEALSNGELKEVKCDAKA